MGILRVRDKSNDEIISVCEIEDLWVNGQPIKQIPTEVNIIKLQNQKAIECLKEMREKMFETFDKIEFDSDRCDEYYGRYITVRFVGDLINNKIKELEGE